MQDLIAGHRELHLHRLDLEAADRRQARQGIATPVEALARAAGHRPQGERARFTCDREAAEQDTPEPVLRQPAGVSKASTALVRERFAALGEEIRTRSPHPRYSRSSLGEIATLERTIKASGFGRVAGESHPEHDERTTSAASRPESQSRKAADARRSIACRSCRRGNSSPSSGRPAPARPPVRT